MEASVTSPRVTLRHAIPPPTVSVRSEFPTLNRSRTQQSLTCLITVEVPRLNYRSTPMEMGLAPMSSAASDMSGLRSPRIRSPPPALPQLQESQEELERITEELHYRVENWHSLDYSRFGKLRLHSQIRVGKDRKAWQDLDCYLFSDMLICVKERKTPSSPTYEGAEPKKPRCTLKGSILIKRHLKTVDSLPGKF
jgi:hypothetical protein